MSETGLRERKKLQTRRRIEQAALELIEHNGFDATTVGDIAKAVDVAPRTFFRYFETKEDVVLADYADRLARLLDVLGERPTDEAPWESLRRAFRKVATDYNDQHLDMRRRMRIMATTPSVFARNLQLQAGWERDLAAALERRESAPSDDITSALLAAAALAVMRASIGHWMTDPSGTDLPSFVDDCFERLALGLNAGSKVPFR